MADLGGVPGPSSDAGVANGVRRRRFNPVVLLLLLPLIGTLIPEIYNRVNPSIGGMPFYYWYQLLWIAISVTCTLIVYLATRRQS
jgi:hypothetical protein